MKKKYWMVCDFSGRYEKQCLFDEETGLKRGDPPRCIRHGSLLFTDTSLNGFTREQARERLDRQ